VHLKIFRHDAVPLLDRSGISVTDGAVRPNDQGRQERLIRACLLVCGDRVQHLANPVAKRHASRDACSLLHLLSQLLVRHVGAVPGSHLQ
jgi:hypothetical protein